ncbi:MAG: UDP-N-acetylglucosamine 2-epimerase [Solirubrobacteraceae bacterium]
MVRKVCIVVTARPSYARIKTVIAAVKAHPDLELQLVVAASALLERYGGAIEVMRADGYEPDALVYMVLEGENTVTMAKSTGLGLVELATVFDNLQPDLVVTVADRYETLATATAASYMNIPTVHVQGGEVTGSIDEKVRHAVTKLSDLHLVCTERAQEFVIRLGERPEAVHRTGCPSLDIAHEIARAPELGMDPIERYGGTGPDVPLDRGFLVVLQHPVTTEEDEAFAQISETLHAVREVGIPVLWFWPNVDAGSDGTSKGIRQFRELHRDAPMHFFRNMPPEEFLRLLIASLAIVGNSSVAIRECSYLGVPAVNIGTRQAGRERGHNVVDVDHDRDAILAACRAQVEHGFYAPDETYGDGRSGQRIADLLSTVELTSSKRLAYV